MADEGTVADRFELALQLHDAGVLIMRENLRRRMPDASEGEIEAAVGVWLAQRPGAEDGDAVGIRRPWPRVR